MLEFEQNRVSGIVFASCSKGRATPGWYEGSVAQEAPGRNLDARSGVEAGAAEGIRRARELGDLRENAEYHAAKERQSYVQARISMLQQRFATVSLINLDKLPQGKAAFGSTVHLRESTGAEVVYQLVMPEDADAEKGRISTSSPIGRAIVGKEEGDEIIVVAPTGRRVFELTRLVTIHDVE